MLDKRQIWAIFLFKFKMDCKAVETTHNINNAFGPGTANEHTVQWWFKVCKEDESLGSEERNGHHWKLTMTNWEQSSKLTLLTQEVGEELNINHFMVIQDLKQIGKVNKLNKWVPHELTANQKSSFWSVLFYVTQQSFSRLDCDVWWKWILYDNWQQPVQWLNQNKQQSTSHRQTCMKKRSWSLFDGLLLIWSTTAFWIPAKPLHLRSMLSKSIRWYWSTERAQLFFTTTLDSTLHNQCFESSRIGLWSFASSPYSPDPITNWLPLLRASRQLQGKHSHNRKEAENALQESVVSWNVDFYATGINLFLVGKRCWL